jgi:hypothetical protein
MRDDAAPVVVHEGSPRSALMLVLLLVASIAGIVVSTAALFVSVGRGEEWLLAPVTAIAATGGFLCASLAARHLRVWRRGGPVLTVDATGIRDVGLTSSTIPWNAIIRLDLQWWYGRHLAVVLKPDEARRLGIGSLDRGTAAFGRAIGMPGFGLHAGPGADGYGRLVAAIRRFRPDLVEDL